MSSRTSTLLRDVIDIPERAGADDYVLRLTEGVEKARADATIRSYVVTQDIARNVDTALTLVQESLKDGTSRAAYLHGSFGSGKSHFMAVVHALLGHNATVRSKPELAAVIARHDPALQDKTFLRLAYHFLDASSIEEVMLGGYLAQIRALHPDCSLPAIHRSDDLLVDAESTRLRMGDDAFLAGLNEGSATAADDPDAGVWGAVIGTRWDRARYDQARTSPHGSPARQELVTALVATYFSAFTRGGEYVSIEQGLEAITTHAKGLGYDAVVAFLDELVLWLTFRVRDQEFFGREVQKLTKLVEGGAGPRPIPLVSFVARQFDLRQYFADSGAGTGADRGAITQAFTQQEGRFLEIRLGDDNLPYVAQKRLLSPKDDAARERIDAAFDALDRRDGVWRVLLDGVNNDESNRGADQQAFRRTYPFSPALVATLRHLAGAMQRDRTALKVMQSLLVKERDTLTVDDVVPVGDVYDLVVSGASGQAISSDMAGLFRNAHAVYTEKLRPELLKEHGLTDQQAREVDPSHPFRADDRLVKTLVLSAIAPQVPALKDLTPGRLAALNHGSITSPLPGQEATTVLAKLNRWATVVPEIHLSEERVPVVRLRVAEVDYESVVQKASREDTVGKRRQTLRTYVFRALGIDPQAPDDIEGAIRRPLVWRGSKREVEVVFGNVRSTTSLPDERFRAGEGTWRLVVDYPFDDEGHSAKDDLARLDDLRGRMTSRTIAWVPRFLSRSSMDDLGRLVVLEWVLASQERWQNHANHLSVEDREQAKTILDNQRNLLSQRFNSAVQQSYGAAAVTAGVLAEDAAHDRVLVSLDPSFTPAAPVAAALAGAFDQLLDAAFTSAFPQHPRFEPLDDEVRPRELLAVLAAIDSALQADGRRAFIEPAQRAAVRRVANPLELGYMGETHFLFTPERFPWHREIAQAMGKAQLDHDADVTVGQVRGWVRGAREAGLLPSVIDLVVCAWARHEDRAWFLHGAPLPQPDPGRLIDSTVLRPQPMPGRSEWQLAHGRAMTLFGINSNPHLTASSLTAFDKAVRDHVALHVPAAGPLVEAVAEAYRRLGLPTHAETAADDGELPVGAPTRPPGRLGTADAAAGLVSTLGATRTPVQLVEALATLTSSTTDQALARSLSAAPQVLGELASFDWDRLTAVRRSQNPDARRIIEALKGAVQADEISLPLAGALRTAEQAAWTWLQQQVVQPDPKPPIDDDRRVGRPKGGVRIAAQARLEQAMTTLSSELTAAMNEHPDAEIEITWRLVERG